LGNDVDFSLPSERVIRALDHIIEWRGRPQMIRCDNRPEYVSGVTLSWAEQRGIHIEFIQPGQPQQNAYVERYNRTVRYDRLAQHLFDSLEEIQDFATRWLWTYNHDRLAWTSAALLRNKNWHLPLSIYSLIALKMGGLPFFLRVSITAPTSQTVRLASQRTD
jgi:putative transposase